MTRLYEIWTRGQLNYSLGNQWRASTNADYRDVFNEGDLITIQTLSQDFVYLPNSIIELVGSLRLFHTNADPDSNNELRPAIGFRIDLLRSGRFTIGNYLRFESRHIYFDEESLNIREGRFRNRIFGSVALNKKVDFSNNPLVFRWGLELFTGTNTADVKKFLSRYRAEAGFGYNLTDNWRFHLAYFMQNTRPAPRGSFDLRDNIFFLTCFYTLLPRK
jgi:hypothetical protein